MLILSTLFLHSIEKISFEIMTLYKTPFFLQEICSYSYIDILTMFFNYTQMKMTYLSGHPPNMNSIGEVCDRLGTDSLTSFVGNHWATPGLGEGREYKRSIVCLHRVEIKCPAVSGRSPLSRPIKGQTNGHKSSNLKLDTMIFVCTCFLYPW